MSRICITAILALIALPAMVNAQVKAYMGVGKTGFGGQDAQQLYGGNRMMIAIGKKSKGATYLTLQISKADFRYKNDEYSGGLNKGSSETMDVREYALILDRGLLHHKHLSLETGMGIGYQSHIEGDILAIANAALSYRFKRLRIGIYGDARWVPGAPTWSYSAAPVVSVTL